MLRRPAHLAPLSAALVGLAGCGLNVASPDLFQLTRTGPGGRLVLIANDAGTIRCNGRRAVPISSALLLKARALVTNLDKDAKASLSIPPSSQSVFTYAIRTQDGTVRFPDTAAGAHPELGAAEEFALAAVRGPCAGR